MMKLSKAMLRNLRLLQRMADGGMPWVRLSLGEGEALESRGLATCAGSAVYHRAGGWTWKITDAGREELRRHEEA